jgi:hypothetical protein
MQAIFEGNEHLIGALRGTISEARFARYLQDSNGDQRLGLQLYHWNSSLSQCLYFSVQVWEVALRNKLNVFLCRKYNGVWPYDQRALRQLTRSDKDRLSKTIERQKQERKIHRPTADMVVADLSAGFWVSLLTQSYDVPFAWRYNLTRVLPHNSRLTRDAVSVMCDRILVVRNRIAHHEPIYHLPLDDIRADLATLVAAMCPGADAYATGMCDFGSIWDAKPFAQSGRR